MFSFPTVLRTGLLAAAVSLAGCNMMPTASNTTAFTATLSGAAEVPPKSTAGAGTLTATLDKTTSVLTWKLDYTGLTGPATMAHFHGPAAVGANAGVVVPFSSAMSGTQGTATLTPAQIADLTAGRWYANVHTAANPGGEIRGQVMAK